MSKLERIATFIAVVEENGFAAAARKKNISTAAISRQVSRLEIELGSQLLRRSTRQVSLTEVGEKYYESCKKAVEDLAIAEIAITGSQSVATGILSVMSSRYFAFEYIMPRLSEFMVHNPKLKIKFELAERFPDLVNENIDILFGVSMEGGPQGLIRKRVSTTRYILCASPDYFKKHGVPKIPSDLQKNLYITHSMRRPDNVLMFKNENEIHVQPILWLNDSLAMRECAIKNMGIVKLHDYVVNDALQNGNLIEILRDFQEPEQSIYLYYQQSRYLQPKIRHFIDFYTS